MGATLEALRALQEIDLQINDIKQQLARRETAVRIQQIKLAELRQTEKEQHDQFLRVQKDTDALDLDLKARAAHVAKLRTQLNTAKTNKEYAAVLQEINTQKADETHVESSVMELLQEIDRKKTALDETRNQAEQIELKVDQAQQQLQRTKESLADRLEALNKRRTEATAALDPPVAHMFDRTSERYEGEAMARIVRTHPRRDEFICDGCYMTLNLERFNAVMTRDEVQNCSSCGRILYVDVDG